MQHSLGGSWRSSRGKVLYLPWVTPLPALWDCANYIGPEPGLGYVGGGLHCSRGCHTHPKMPHLRPWNILLPPPPSPALLGALPICTGDPGSGCSAGGACSCVIVWCFPVFLQCSYLCAGSARIGLQVFAEPKETQRCATDCVSAQVGLPGILLFVVHLRTV